MNNSKLFQLLRSLSNYELKELEVLLLSPFFNKNKTIIKFYKKLIRYAPDFNHHSLKKEFMASTLFQPSDKGRVKKLQYAMSDFVKLIENYLVQKELAIKVEENNLLLLQAYKRKGLDKLFSKKVNDFDKLLDKAPYRDIEYFHLKYRLNNTVLTHSNTAKVSKTIDSLKETFQYLDSFYFSSKFLQSIVFNDRRHTFEEDYDFFIEKELLALSNKEELNNIPLFKIYRLLMQEKEEKTLHAKVNIYFKLKEEVFNRVNSK